MRARVLFAACLLVGGTAATATAQSSERVFVSVNGTFQTTQNPFTDRIQFDVNRETGSTEARYPVKGDVLLDGSIAVRVWRNISAGVAVSRFAREEVVTTDSRLPH